MEWEGRGSARGIHGLITNNNKMLYKAHFLKIGQCALNNHDIQNNNKKYTSIVLGFPKEAFPIGLLPPTASSVQNDNGTSHIHAVLFNPRKNITTPLLTNSIILKILKLV